MKNKLKILLLIPIICFIILWLGNLLYCDILTVLYGNNFKNNPQIYERIGEIDYLKVLNCSSNNARVYYITKDKSTGQIMSFVKIEKEWILKEWEQTVWSGVGGSASEVIWPYWWHFIYGGI